MSGVTYETENPSNQIVDIIKDLIKKLPVEDQRKVSQAVAMLNSNERGLEDFLGNTTSKVEQLAADPASPSDGRLWINTTSNQLKVQKAGVTVVIV